MRKKKINNESQRKEFYEDVIRTQHYVPIKDIVNGVLVNDKGKFVKVMEVLPVPFEFKKIAEQNRISNAFKMFLKIAPDNLHFKAMSIHSDLTKQINNLKENIDAEKDLNCKKMANESLQRLYEAQTYGITKRFFFSFSYDKTISFNNRTLPEILYNINNEAFYLKNALNSCGNDVVDWGDNQNFELAKILYMIYNRDRYLDQTFEKRLEDVTNIYYKATGKQDAYIPPFDLIAPDKMSTIKDKYLLVNNTYYAFMYIPSNGYNPDVITGWLDRVITNEDGIDVDIFLKKRKREEVITNIKRSIASSKVTLRESNDISESYDSSNSLLKSAYYLKDGLGQGEEYMNMSIIVTVSAPTPEAVDEKMEALQKQAYRYDVTLHENKFRLLESFNAVLPSSFYDESLYTFKKTRRNVLTDSASSVYPFTTYNINDSNGIYIADDFNGSPVIINFFDHNRVRNPHVFLAGESGSGKSTSGMIMALRFHAAHAKENGFVIILAPEKENEFYRVCDAVNGQKISIGAGSSNRLNIMEITPRGKEAEERIILDGEDEFVTRSLLMEKINVLMEFFEMYISDLKQDERSLLNDAIIETYERKGITANNMSLWQDEKHTCFKQMPILSDLVSVLAEKEETVRLSRILKVFTTGEGAYFDGQTNVNINNRFIVVGLEKNSQSMLPFVIFAAMEWAWGRIKQDERHKMLWIDEWWKLAYNPHAAMHSLRIAKLARSYHCSMVISTQNLSDIMAVEDGKYGKAVLNNCATKILLSMKEQDIQSVQDLIGLNDREVQPLSKFKAGQALMINSDATIALKFMPSETEKLLIFTDKETREKYVRLKLEEEANDGIREVQNESIFDDESQNNVIEEELLDFAEFFGENQQ